MPFTKAKCPQCNKTAESQKEFEIGDNLVLLLKCGHIMKKEHLSNESADNIESTNGKRPYPFQVTGIKFLENSGGRALLADEMGLGKTVQALGLLSLHKEMLPFLAIVKASLKTQWQHMTMTWMGEESFAQVLDGPKDHPLPGCTGYIVSYDILRRLADLSKKEKADLDLIDDPYLKNTSSINDKKTSKLKDLIAKLKIKTIILDECQQIKNIESQRTIFTRQICKEVPYVIALSGTPIKNNASEYFPVLNILKPEMYPNYSRFLTYECDSYFTGYGYKVGGLAHPDRFKEKTKSFILRRERKEVLPDLPPIRRDFQFCDLAKEVEKAYIDTFKKFRDDYNSDGHSGSSFEEQGNILAYLSRMRHLTGLSKIDPCIDHVMEIMGSTDDRVCIFVHHNDVADILTQKLNQLFLEVGIPPCARHRAGSQASDTERNFEQTRVLVASTLAGGEGMNLQKLCARFVMLERQWNPANEEQAEARFPRPEGLKVDSIEGVYFIAVGTVDEFFTELVEKKREIVSKTLGGQAVQWDQTSLMKELAEILAIKGGQKWGF